MNSTMKKYMIFLILFLAFCAPGRKTKVSPQLVDYQSRIKDADSLVKRGSYSFLKEASQIYRELHAFRRYQKQTKEKLIKADLLLTLREKELGILEHKSLEEASQLIQASPPLPEYSVYLDIVDSIPRNTKGFVYDFLTDSSKIDAIYNKLKKDVPRWAALLREKYKTEEFFAYLYISLVCNFYPYLEEKKPDLSPISQIFPQSPLIQYKLSISPAENEERLNLLLEKEPLFYEAYYFLGELSLKRGQLVTAEENFLKVYQQIPESSSTVISLASIYFAFEELGKSLEFYEQALKMAPEYRHALLGKAICLSYLEKNEKAIECCNTLIALGSFFMGESYYWLAWNQNELENLDAAWENAENAKKYLYGSSELLTLSGIIAFKKENLEKAEKNFMEALQINAFNYDANFYLGNIYAKKDDWKNSGSYFGQAAYCSERTEKALEEKIKEIEDSSLSPERKERLVSRKRAQLRKNALAKATAFYNGAAGYFNAGIKEEALNLAQKASLHSAFKEKAQELIDKIKNQP
jgi:tetratricopeptide (TPR) repeat protein